MLGKGPFNRKTRENLVKSHKWKSKTHGNDIRPIIALNTRLQAIWTPRCLGVIKFPGAVSPYYQRKIMIPLNPFDFKFILIIYLSATEANMNLARRLFSTGRSSSTSKQPVLDTAKSPTQAPPFQVGSKTSKAPVTHRLPPSNAQKAGGGIPRPQTGTQRPPTQPKMPPSGRAPRHAPDDEKQMREGIRKDSLK